MASVDSDSGGAKAKKAVAKVAAKPVPAAVVYNPADPAQVAGLDLQYSNVAASAPAGSTPTYDPITGGVALTPLPASVVAYDKQKAADKALASITRILGESPVPVAVPVAAKAVAKPPKVNQLAQLPVMGDMDLRFSNVMASEPFFEDSALAWDRGTQAPVMKGVGELGKKDFPLAGRNDRGMTFPLGGKASPSSLPPVTYRPAPPAPPPLSPAGLAWLAALPAEPMTPRIDAQSELFGELRNNPRFKPTSSRVGGMLGLPDDVAQVLVDRWLAESPIQTNERERIRNNVDWLGTGLGADPRKQEFTGRYLQGDIQIANGGDPASTLLHETAHKLWDINLRRNPADANAFMAAVERMKSDPAAYPLLETVAAARDHGMNVLANIAGKLPSAIPASVRSGFVHNMPPLIGQFSGPVQETYAMLIQAVDGDLSKLPPYIRPFYEGWVEPQPAAMFGPTLSQLRTR